jgi:hypothetical protein
MLFWTIAQAKRDFSLGVLTSFRIEKSPMSDGWNVMLYAGLNIGYLVDARLKSRRDFITLDALVSSLRKIGFSVVVLVPSSR